jgi:hypothetical protein
MNVGMAGRSNRDYGKSCSMAKGKGRKRIVFLLTKEEVRLARKLARRESRDGGSSIHLWAREVVRQYLHEYQVMPEAWDEPSPELFR